MKNNFKIIYFFIAIIIFVTSCVKKEPPIPLGSIHPCPGIDTIVYEGKVYHSIQIGSQCWLRESLDCGNLAISDCTGINHSDSHNDIYIEKYCYNNNADSCIKYGGFYDWNEMMNYTIGEKIQGICPSGWHIPSYGEMDSLINILGGYGLAGKQIKKTGTIGFDLLLGGDRVYMGNFDYMGIFGNIWTSTSIDDSSAYCFYVAGDTTSADLDIQGKTNGHHVRCKKD